MCASPAVTRVADKKERGEPVSWYVARRLGLESFILRQRGTRSIGYRRKKGASPRREPAPAGRPAPHVTLNEAGLPAV
jgi:hypothetical protein